MQTNQRAYQPVWQKLKRTPFEVTLEVVHADLVPRIKRMVSKEKDMDLGFKFKQQVEKFRLVYTFDNKTKRLNIKLRSRFGLTDPV